MIRVQLRCYKLTEDATLPERAHKDDAGADVFSAADVTIQPGQTLKIPTQLSVQMVCVNQAGDELVGEDLPAGFGDTWTWGGFIWDKSGLGSRGIQLGGGVVDHPFTGHVEVVASYWGNMNVFLVNLIHLLKKLTFLPQIGSNLESAFQPLAIKKGQKIGQLVVQRVELAEIVDWTARAKPVTLRGDSGFGSTGEGQLG